MTFVEQLEQFKKEAGIKRLHVFPGTMAVTEEELAKAILESLKRLEAGECEEVDLDD